MKFIVIILIFYSLPIFALPWSIDKSIEGKVEWKVFQARYPDINSPYILNRLLIDLAQNNHFLSLQAKLSEDKWLISGEVARSISELKFNIVTRELKIAIQGATLKYLNRTNSVEAKQAIIDVASSILSKSGYPSSKVIINEEIVNDKLIYVVNVEEGEPCYIERVEIAFSLPAGVGLNIGQGDLCDVSRINQEIESLEEKIREKGYVQLKFDNYGIDYIRGKTRGVVRVMGTLGKKLRYSIDDSRKLFLINDLFNQEEYSGLDPNILGPEAMKYELLKRYRSRGYVDVEVADAEEREIGQDVLEYFYKISPGIRYTLESIEFEGVTLFSREQLLDIMDINDFWQSANALNIDELREGLDKLRAKYRESGYWNVKIIDPRITKDKSRATAQVVIVVREDLQRKLEKVEYRGVKFFKESDLSKLLDMTIFDPIDREKLLLFEQKIREMYVESGFLYANIRILTRFKADRKYVPTEVVVDVHEGLRVKVGTIRLVGLVRTDKKVIYRELTFKTGDWYQPSKINQSRRALVDLGIFSSIQITPTNKNAITEELENIDLIVEAKEGNSGTVVFGPGYDIYRGLTFAAENTYKNIGGVGRQFSLRASLSQEKQQKAITRKTFVGRKFGAGYVEPHIFDSPLDAKISLSHKATADEFWTISQSGEVSLNYKFNSLAKLGNVSVFYGQKFNKEEGRPGQQEVGVTTGDVRIGRTGLRLDLDWRDDRTWPTDGSLLIANLSWARYPLGGNLRYFRWELVNNYYHDLSNRFVLAYGASITAFHGIEKKDDALGVLPATERLNAGGPDLVRGFERQLGPYVRRPVVDPDTDTFTGFDKDTIGGDRRVILKAELRYRISTLIGSSFFVDSGNAFLSPDQLQVFEDRLRSTNDESGQEATVEENVSYGLNDIMKKPGYLISRHYYSYGLACNILTPLGAINIAYALPWKEPKSVRCAENDSYCLTRAKDRKRLIEKGRFELSVGARF
ncbi:MAG: BamA/TamA family outer membrane protein [Bdellovibrionota bacterium]